MHEIVTVQVGKQSNYLATHFWNVQESYFTYAEDAAHSNSQASIDHDVNFRQGLAPDGTETFTPRTLIYDFKNEFGTLRRINELYDVVEENPSEALLWNSSAVVQRQPQITQNAYQKGLSLGLERPQLNDRNVRFWSDYNRIFYNPRSIVQVYETSLSPGMRAFDDWSAGESLFTTLDQDHDLLDRDIRPFVEECDQLQGFQMLSSVESAWGGFSARYLDRLRDEFGKAAIWTWAIDGKVNAERRTSGLLNETRALVEMAHNSTLYIPVTAMPQNAPSNCTVNVNSAWQLSAMQATAFETISLPSRLSSSDMANAAKLDEIAEVVNSDRRRPIASLSYSVVEDATSGKSLDAQHTSVNLLPHEPAQRPAQSAGKVHSELQVCRGNLEAFIPANIDDGNLDTAYRRITSPVYFPQLDAFPSIYGLEATDPVGISVQASLLTSSAIANWIQGLNTWSAHRIPVQDREEFTNCLHDTQEAYQETSFSDDSNGGWDD